MNPSAWITVGTKMDTSKFDKQYERLEKRARDKEIKMQVKIQNVESAKRQIESLEKELATLTDNEDAKKAEKYFHLRFKGVENLTKEELREWWQLEQNEKLYEDIQKEIFNKGYALENATSKLAKEEGLLKKEKSDYADIIKQMEEVKHAKEEAIKTQQLGTIKGAINDIGKSVKNVTKKIARWGLAILSVRSAYFLIRQAMSTLSSYNDDLASKLNSIKLVLTVALEPVVNRIVQAMVTLVNYVNYLTKAWFGLDLFARASELATKKMSDNLASGVSSAKEMNKQLAGFDEMNVLQDNSSAGGGGGASTTGADAFNIPEVEIPAWLKWIADNGDRIKDIIVGIGVALASLKIASFLQALGLFGSLPLWQIIAGVGLILAGIILLVKGIIDFINDPSWYNFLTILEGIALIVAGIAVLMNAWVIALIALGVAIVSYVIQNWDKVKEILGTVGTWIYDNIIVPVGEFFQKLWDKIKEIFGPVVDFFSSIFSTAFENVKIMVDNLKQIFKFLWDKIKEIFGPVATWFKDKFTLAFNKIKEVFSPFVSFFADLWEKVKNKLKDFGTKIGEVIGGAFKKVINGVLDAIESILNKPVRAINEMIDTLNDIPGLKLTKLKTFNLPRLAKGGIINYPGKGVPIGGAIGGERGKEGVIPLTDSQQMALLGEAIGKYITINATITNTMNGRVISRELQKINNESDFAFNR